MDLLFPPLLPKSLAVGCAKVHSGLQQAQSVLQMLGQGTANFLLCKEKTIFRPSGLKKGQHTLPKLKHCATLKASSECSGNHPSFRGTECCSNKAEGPALLSYVFSISKRKDHASMEQNLNCVCPWGKGGLQRRIHWFLTQVAVKVLTFGLSRNFSQEVMCEIYVIPIKAQPNTKLQHML